MKTHLCSISTSKPRPMNCFKGKIVFAGLFFGFSFSFLTSAIAFSHILLPTITPVHIRNQDNEFSRKDVQRFITTIALIHHYYINDIDNDKLFSSAIDGMIAGLDPHSSYLNANDLKELETITSGELVGIGIELTLSKDRLLRIISALDDSPANLAGIKPDDLIIKINDQLVQNMSLAEAVSRIKGKKNTSVKLTVFRKSIDKPIVFTITRKPIHLISVKSKILEPGYGYIRITFFQGPVAIQLHKAITKLKIESNSHLEGLVLDLRNNPGGLLDVSAKVADTFLDASKIHQYKDYIVYTKGRVSGSSIHIKATSGDLIPNTPIVVLINGGSASASEVVAGALQDYKRAIIMGTPSFGKGSVQTVLPISRDDAIKLTTALYYTPSGREIQAKGIIPNITVPELSVKTDEANLTLSEVNLQNHLPNDMVKSRKKEAEQAREILKARLKLAKIDYQLYEALLMLRGLNSFCS